MTRKLHHIRSVADYNAIVSGLSVVDTAYSLGFNYPHYFTRAFKQRFGLLPSDYQKGAK